MIYWVSVGVKEYPGGVPLQDMKEWCRKNVGIEGIDWRVRKMSGPEKGGNYEFTFKQTLHVLLFEGEWAL